MTLKHWKCNSICCQGVNISRFSTDWPESIYATKLMKSVRNVFSVFLDDPVCLATDGCILREKEIGRGIGLRLGMPQWHLHSLYTLLGVCMRKLGTTAQEGPQAGWRGAAPGYSSQLNLHLTFPSLIDGSVSTPPPNSSPSPQNSNTMLPNATEPFKHPKPQQCQKWRG